MQALESLRRQSPKSQADDRNLFGLFLLVSLVLSGLTLLSTSFLWMTVMRQRPPTLVQAVDGRAMIVSPMESRDRMPMVIRKFVSDSLVLLLSASGKLPPTSDKPSTKDIGVSINLPNQGQAKVSTATWQASFALSEDFRPAALRSIAGLTPAGSFSGQAQMILVPMHVSEPKKIGAGQWRVNLIANLTIISVGNTQGRAVPFNKQVFVRAVDTPQPTAVSSPLERAVFTTRQAGLEIYAMKDYAPGDIQK